MSLRDTRGRIGGQNARVSVPLSSFALRRRRGRNEDTCQNNWHTGVSNLTEENDAEDAVERIGKLRHRASSSRPANRRCQRQFVVFLVHFSAGVFRSDSLNLDDRILHVYSRS